MPEPRKKILIVDDEVEMLTFLTHILNRHQYDVIFTDKGKEAYEMAKDMHPDAIILDVLIPDLMGPEIEKQLAGDPETSGIPVIFLSGLNTKEDERIMFDKTGLYRVLAKPTTAKRILRAIRQALEE